jgi:hypothetical protein
MWPGVTAAGGFILVLSLVFFVLFYEQQRGHLLPAEG